MFTGKYSRQLKWWKKNPNQNLKPVEDFIYFDVDPSKIDVNIHPTKTEVKFEDESSIFPIIKYLDSGWAKYNPLTEALGYIAPFSVSEMPDLL